jgi:hypothetical protein
MKDGGSAFPVMDTWVSPETGEKRLDCMSYGMSLRDFFASQALAGICYKATWDDGEENVVAGWAYDMADAMLAEREKEAPHD